MNKIKDNINFLKNVIQKRETYIRFSPLGTAIMWLMYLFYYFFSDNICSILWDLWSFSCLNPHVFLLIWVVWVILVTILSLFNSENKWEELLPKSIRYIIVNLVFIWIAFFSIAFEIFHDSISLLIPFSFLFYWLLIIVSRFCIPKSIQYFWYIIFLFWILILWPLSNYTKEIILLVFWFGHLVVSVLLKINNDKNG